MSRCFTLLICLFLLALPLQADEGLIDPSQMPGPLKEVRFDQQLGAELPLNAVFMDEHGKAVKLGDYFGGEKPVLLTFVYYDCPMLCTLVLQGMTKMLKVLKFNPGQEFEIVIVSFDPGEGPSHALEEEQETLKLYGRPETADGWHFLTGGEGSIRQITEAAGFQYVYVPENGEWAHASGIIIVTPEGKIAQYYYGIEYPPKNVRLALVEASTEKIGSVVDQLLLYCFRYNPLLGKYTAVTMRVLRVVGGLFSLGLILFVTIMWRRDGIRDRANLGAAPQ